jgi:hypothetical protein
VNKLGSTEFFFFFFLDLLGVFFCIVPKYLGCAPCAFNEFPLLTKKNSQGIVI